MASRKYKYIHDKKIFYKAPLLRQYNILGAHMYGLTKNIFNAFVLVIVIGVMLF